MNENTFPPFMSSWNCLFSSCSESGWWRELVLLCRMRLQHHRFDFCTEKFFLGHWNSSLLLASPLNGGHTWDRQYSHLEHWFNAHCSVEEGENGATSGSSTPLSQNTSVCGGLYDLLCFWGPSPSPHCWMSAPWFSLGSFAPRKWREEGKEKERGW